MPKLFFKGSVPIYSSIEAFLARYLLQASIMNHFGPFNSRLCSIINTQHH